MGKQSILIVDYGVGNLFNVQRAFETLGAAATISRDPEEILKAERILLPGVGAFAAGMQGVREHGLTEVLQEVARKGTTPFLGICLGMQLLMDSSEENGNWQGLGLIAGTVKRFTAPDQSEEKFKIPQIGWNTIEPAQGADWSETILSETPAETFMYFVHSYHVVPADPADRLAETVYGKDRFCSVIRRGSIWGCQFHPERSGEKGLALLNQFLKQS